MLSAEQKNRAFNELWEHSLIGLAFIAEDGKFISANPAFCAITEYNEFELQSRSFQDITHPDDQEPDLTMIRRIAAGEGQQYTMKKRYITKTGRTVWVVLRARVVRNDEGQLEFFLSQVSELIELQPPKLPVQYPAAHDLGAHYRRATTAEWLARFWPIVLAGAGGLGVFVAELVKYLYM